MSRPGSHDYAQPETRAAARDGLPLTGAQALELELALQHADRERSEWRRRYHAEAGLPVDGWWLDTTCAPEDLVWFAEDDVDGLDLGTWCVHVVQQDPAGPWFWSVDQWDGWEYRDETQGQSAHAWEAMRDGLAALMVATGQQTDTSPL